MFVPILLLFLSLAGAVASVWAYGPVLSDLFLLCALGAIASAILVLRARPRDEPKFIVIDGSNVLHWNNRAPSMTTVKQVVRLLEEQDYVPVVWFDANIGYKISNRYLGPYPLSRILNLSLGQVHVAPKGTPADPLLLEGAGTLKANVVTNDRFRDWVEDHPQIAEPGFLVHGRVRGDGIELDMAEEPEIRA